MLGWISSLLSGVRLPKPYEPPSPQPVFAGEQIECENGHLICEVEETINRGDLNWSQKLINWQMPEPERESQPVCNVCGGRFWKAIGFCQTLHVRNRGWVPNYGEEGNKED